MKTRILLLAAFLAVVSAGCTLLAPPPEFRGLRYEAPAPPPSFSLPATNGETFTLNEQRGKILLLFFGYTACPDICPITLGSMKSALGQLSAEERQQVQLIFISVDPRRDSLERVAGYLARFDSGFIGVAPSQEELNVLMARYGVFAEPEENSEGNENYLVTHTGLTYVIDKDGELRLGILSDASPDDIVHDLRILIEE